MGGYREGFQEHWAAYMARRMAEQIAAALATGEAAARRRALDEALAFGREALLRVQSEATSDEWERRGLRDLEIALDCAQAAMNAVDILYDPTLRDALAAADQAADALARVGEGEG